jgi:DNA-binding transcriptional LysR family regulator
MRIASHQLRAFFETAKHRSFSKAADFLGVTQSALSQRIANLEDELELTLFIRDPSGPILTSDGEILLRHCQTTLSLEEEMLGQLKSSQNELRGSVRIAGFSSVLRSLIIPAMASFLRSHRELHFEFRSSEMDLLPQILKTAEADFIVLDFQLNKKGIVEHVLGLEEYVVIESAKFDSAENVYLDHSQSDLSTEAFFRAQTNTAKNLKRKYLGDVYGIIEGVELGLGRAVMSKHLVKKNSKVKIVNGFKKFNRTITLNYFERPYYSRVHQKIVAELLEKVPRLLELT